MKKTKIIFGVVLISIAIAIISFRTGDTPMDSMSNLPEGKYFSESTSPNGTYTIRTYLSDKGGSTVANAVRGELIINNKNKKNKKNEKPRNIYWDYKIDVSKITWESDDTVIINGHTIYLPEGKYDWRVDK